MSDGGDSGNNFLWAILILLIQALVVIVFLPGSILEQTMETEIGWLESVHSNETMRWVAEATHALYSLLIERSGLGEAIAWTFLPESEASEGVNAEFGQQWWLPYMESRGTALSALTHLMLIRLVTLAAWLPLYAIILLPSILDGLFERSIKRHTFRYPSPIAHRFGIRMVFILFFLTLVGLLSPLPVPPLVLPLGLAVATATLGITVLGNLPKRL